MKKVGRKETDTPTHSHTADGTHYSEGTHTQQHTNNTRISEYTIYTIDWCGSLTLASHLWCLGGVALVPPVSLGLLALYPLPNTKPH